MADPRGFMKYTERELPSRRPVDVRIGDWKEVYGAADPSALTRQASRCMIVVFRSVTKAAHWAT